MDFEYAGTTATLNHFAGFQQFVFVKSLYKVQKLINDSSQTCIDTAIMVQFLVSISILPGSNP